MKRNITISVDSEVHKKFKLLSYKKKRSVSSELNELMKKEIEKKNKGKEVVNGKKIY